MKIAERFAAKAADNWNAPAVTIACLGDSVTQGCFGLHNEPDGGFDTFFDQRGAYHAQLAEMLSKLFPSVPVNIINAGISGSNAQHGLERLERDVISHRPDLTIVCFGLNDSGGGLERLDNYVNALDAIFTRLEEAGIETIFMTPNMMCTGVSAQLEDERYRSIALDCSRTQNNGILEAYLNAAMNLCRKRDVAVCDCYAKWKALERSGANITELLANKINHPTREMNRLFAVSLLETMFG